MTRIQQTIWPVLAMLISFVALFALTWLFASERPTAETLEPEPSVSAPAPQTEAPTPTPSPTPTPALGELMVSVVGHARVQGDWSGGASPDPVPVVDGVLERRNERLCLIESFAQKWRPQDEQGWEPAGPTICRAWPTDQPFDLRFVHK